MKSSGAMLENRETHQDVRQEEKRRREPHAKNKKPNGHLEKETGKTIKTKEKDNKIK